MLGNRSFFKIIAAPFHSNHRRALIKSFNIYTKPFPNLWRYLTGKGEYPYQPKIKTPIGILQPMLFTHHDLLTINEIFCREDYKSGNDSKIVCDIGSNIGLSALYFLSRSADSFCYLFEPVPMNIERMKINLRGFENRYQIDESAVSDVNGEVEFGIESTGRYGGMNSDLQTKIKVKTKSINDVIGSILEKHEFIDVVKIDTEGSELKLLKSIDNNRIKRIKKIFLEAELSSEEIPESFNLFQYGPIAVLTNKSS
ncbi:MAG: FkbM family methyltransferase [Melioribacteraceae bacterium]|nr:FkbM family methyltransferase [Melioribacteraceae bacterium]MCF8353385.1 FkbM family methyltransferase [Melioribacteraceae bacterium]MCF8393036.1 FkbM family methyltransferase [Melioribacteraceae bacterium]MCF8419111.1 FkbM family methyltransferase [Melioribacteraceae bacterium]